MYQTATSRQFLRWRAHEFQTHSLQTTSSTTATIIKVCSMLRFPWLFMLGSSMLKMGRRGKKLGWNDSEYLVVLISGHNQGKRTMLKIQLSKAASLSVATGTKVITLPSWPLPKQAILFRPTITLRLPKCYKTIYNRTDWLVTVLMAALLLILDAKLWISATAKEFVEKMANAFAQVVGKVRIVGWDLQN